MLTAVVTRGATIEVRLVSTVQGFVAEGSGDTAESEVDCEFQPEAGSTEPCGEGPSPILPEAKELYWGAGAFIVMAIFLIGYAVPKVMKGMQARYDHIREGHEAADSARAAAKADVAQYESSLATVKAEAHDRIEAARQQLEKERSEKLAEVNAAIAARRDAANAESIAARHAVQDQVAAAVADVTSRTLELSLGKVPDAGKVRAAVDSVMPAEVSS